MRLRTQFLLLLLLSLVSAKAQDVDVLHYSYMLSLGDEDDNLVGVAYVTFARAPGTSAVSLDLRQRDKDGKGMKVSSVANVDNSPIPLTFQHNNEKLFIQLPPNPVRDTFTVSVAYSGIPSDGLIISKNKFGDRTFFADNWPNRAHHWIPCVDRPGDKASVQFVVAAPSHYSVIANGIKTEEKDYGTRKMTSWEETTPVPTKVMVIGVAKFATKIFSDKAAGVPVSAWVYPQDSAKGFYDYAITPGIIRFFADYIAPFPFKKLANVQSKTIFGGMENASCIFYAENSVTGDRTEEDLYAHEIAHQWFGDAASEKSFPHLWLSEGFATFLTNYYFEKKYGVEAAQKRWAKQRSEVLAFVKKNNRPVVDSTSDLMSLLNANSYQKGAWVLHMLRHEVGDTAFQKIIRTYYDRFKGSNADSRDFERVAEEASRKELTWFFDQWLYRPGVPKLKLTANVKGKVGLVTVTQVGPLYQLKLPVTIVSRDGTATEQSLTITERVSVFRLPLLGQGSKIIATPGSSILFEEVR